MPVRAPSDRVRLEKLFQEDAEEEAKLARADGSAKERAR
jgi:hypothetical protein